MTESNKKTIIVPPGYEYVADEINAEETGITALFLDSVDGSFIDEENYDDEAVFEVPLTQEEELAQALESLRP